MDKKKHSLKTPVMTHRAFLALAIPLIFSAMTTPLIGAVDTAIVGHLQDPALIGGVAVGALIFNTMYWLFGFLRVSTSGFSAQALGRKKEDDIMLAFVRPFLLAMFVGLSFILLQHPIKSASLLIISPPEHVGLFAEQYVAIRIWGAPFALISYVVIGWLMGIGRIRGAVTIQIGTNLLNVALDFLFVYWMQWGIGGVAAASLIAEVTGAVAGCLFVLRCYSFSAFSSLTQVLDKRPILHMLTVNRDLFIRTICLLTVLTTFTSIGARFGEVSLAANAILLQLHYLMAYMFDGVANAASIVVGRSVGARDRSLFERVVRLDIVWSSVICLWLVCTLGLMKEPIIALFTSIPAVQAETLQLFGWIMLFPIAGFWGLQLHGMFSGATVARPIRQSMIIAMLVFLISCWLFVPLWGNNGLWLSFIVFTIARSMTLHLSYPALRRLFHDKERSIGA